MALRELASLEKYLGLKKPNKYSTQGDKKTPVLQNNTTAPLVGLVTIACHLVKESKHPELLGDTADSRAVVQQWLEYRVTKLDSREDFRTTLKDLNLYLQDKVFLAGNHFTLADILMCYGLHPIIVDLSIQEKEEYVNVSRWFDHIQHYPGVRHHLPPVVVLRNRIYTSLFAGRRRVRHVPTRSHFLATSCVGSSEQSNVSPRVRDQSEAPISPTTTTVDAAGHGEGSGLTSCHTDPANQGQNPGPWATVSHCVSFHPRAPTGGYWREEDEGRRKSERARSEGREAAQRTSAQRPRDLCGDMNNDLCL